MKKSKIEYIIRAVKTKEGKGVKYMSVRDKSKWVLIVFILAGLVIGGLLGDLASKVDLLWWLGYGQEFGLTSPVELNLSIVQISFAMLFKINIASIIGVIISLIIYHRV